MRPLMILGLDPSLTHFGFALMEFDGVEPKLLDTAMTETSPTTEKQMAVSYDNLMRAKHHRETISYYLDNYAIDFIAAEIPSGTQSAKASHGLGIAVGLVASIDLPIIAVKPLDVKQKTAGAKASKAAMIQWAYNRYPDPELWSWDSQKKRLLNENEHIADAVAIVHTAILTESFKLFCAGR